MNQTANPLFNVKNTENMEVRTKQHKMKLAVNEHAPKTILGLIFLITISLTLSSYYPFPGVHYFNHSVMALVSSSLF